MSTIAHPPVREALKHLETLYSDEEFRLLVERREQALVDAEDALDYAHHESRQKGLQQGAANALFALIIHKFDSVPEWASHRIRQATETDLKRWTLQVLDAQRIEDVFS